MVGSYGICDHCPFFISQNYSGISEMESHFSPSCFTESQFHVGGVNFGRFAVLRWVNLID
jgi:hypothetical protein